MKEKFIGRTEGDRIQLAILEVLTDIYNKLGSSEKEFDYTKYTKFYDDSQIIDDKTVEEVRNVLQNTESTPKKTTRKKKGE